MGSRSKYLPPKHNFHGKSYFHQAPSPGWHVFPFSHIPPKKQPVKNTRRFDNARKKHQHANNGGRR